VKVRNPVSIQPGLTQPKIVIATKIATLRSQQAPCREAISGFREITSLLLSETLRVSCMPVPLRGSKLRVASPLGEGLYARNDVIP
jgi:hypothetical protein